MELFKPVRFSVKNNEIRNSFNLKESVDGFFDGKSVRCVTTAIFENEELASNMKDAWNTEAHCEVFPIVDTLGNTRYIFICAAPAYFISLEDIEEHSIRYLDRMEDSEASIISGAIYEYFKTMR